MTRRALRIAIASGGFAAALVPVRAPAEAPASADDRPLAQPADGYVGSQACQSCHPGPYASWHDSYHRTMTQVATPKTALGDFENVELQLHGESFRLGRGGDSLWVELGPAERRTRHPIVLATGSHHDQMYWYTTPGGGRDLLQLPFDWSRRLGRWIPAEMSFLQPQSTRASPPEPAQWNTNCSGCHATHPDPALQRGESGAPRFATVVAEFGIACEACHGPGQEHVVANTDPRRRYRLHLEARGDRTILNPRELSHQRSAEVCGQCHSVRFQNAQPATYRPGDELAQHATLIRGALRDPAHPQREEPRMRALLAGLEQDPAYWRSLFWSDGQVRVSGREFSGLRESPCFQRGEISCVSCHALHQQPGDVRAAADWANDQLELGMQGNAACTQCHRGFAAPEALAAHTHHSASSSGSGCYDCHMPHTVYGIQKAQRSHQVSSPSAAETLEVGRPNACNQCHLDRTLAWTAEALEAWYGIPQPALPAEHRTVSATLLAALRGDAGQRVLAAWSLGWEPALATAGSGWTARTLVHLLDDPYASVRFVAYLALRERPEFAGWSYDFSAGAKRRQPAITEARRRARRAWASAPTPARSELLSDAQGRFDTAAFRRLASQRDDTPIVLAE